MEKYTGHNLTKYPRNKFGTIFEPKSYNRYIQMINTDKNNNKQ